MRRLMRRALRVCVMLLFCAVMTTGCGKKEYHEGIENLEGGNYEEAIKKLEEAIEEERNVGDCYRGIGIAKWELSDYQGAIDAFEKALENGSEETGTIYNFLGACKMKLEQPSEAIVYYEKGITQEDSSDEMIREMRFNVIAAYEQLEEWDNARAKLSEYVADYPEDERAVREAQFWETR